MKILLSAYACEPGRGTELGVGWNTVREVAKYHQVWVLTRPDDGREAIEAELARHPVPNLYFIYFTLPIWGSGWKWGNGAFQIHYYLWQIQAYFVARQLHRQIGFDLIQHVTFVKYSSPSFLSLLPVPFIWGPVGGGETAPKVFWQDFSWRGKVYEILRDFSRRLGELDPFARLTARRSVLAWATTEDTARKLSQMGAKNVEVLSQVALLPEEIARLSQSYISSDRPVRFISIGRLLHWKGFHLGLRAFAQADLPSDTEYWILGDGPERKRLQILAQKLGIISQIKFYPEMPRDRIWQMMADARALVHPSLHESGGFVCLEAMAAGRPVVCLDLGGPAVQVTEATGFKVTAIEPQQAVTGIADAMTRLANDAELSAELGKAGQKRANELFNWANKGQQLVQCYDNIFNQ
ncbi:MAG: D-inositol-3-phosphate glycosyltransferase [Chroococcidiopsis sp. SAG 2025]|uniref:glycosyltransferase family 4 protein n=1 Tax=Chroococcidiopsis sp. SAG 2025 TaxID=171389 RepID=UPI002936DAD1|nr:glycosyltransferase family 4 protein [Chroococcidiopsis sp. SAG 2025]MDV2996193.1 D-inositol-3-phosphate glycosyltransferase [Chroococcidiopsis sp. SAG 2025]